VAILKFFYPQPNYQAIAGLPFAQTYILDSSDNERVTAYLIVQSGEADMTGPEGMLHYVEHLVWLNSIGNTDVLTDRHSNAFTTKTSVGYWLKGPKSELPKILKTLMRVYAPITLSDDFSFGEKNIIQREYDFRLGSNPRMRYEEELDRFLYYGTGIARSVIGQPADIARFDLQKALAIHGQTHVPANTVLLIVGDVSASELKVALPELISKNVRVQPSNSTFDFAGNDYKTFHFHEIGLTSSLVWRRVVKLKSFVPYDVLDFRLRLLRNILDANLEGGLARPLRFEKFIARNFDISLNPIDEQTVELRFAAEPDKDVSIEKLNTAFETALKETSKMGIPFETFVRVKDRFLNEMDDWTDKLQVEERFKNYLIERISAKRTPLSEEQFKTISSKLTLEDINDLLAQIAADGRTVIAEISQ
jgi:predicted Zn-dependent peptidase